MSISQFEILKVSIYSKNVLEIGGADSALRETQLAFELSVHLLISFAARKKITILRAKFLCGDLQ